MNMLHGRFHRQRISATDQFRDAAQIQERSPLPGVTQAAFKYICLPIDGTEASFDGAAQGVALAATMQAKVYVFHVLPPLPTVSYLADLIQPLNATYQKAAIALAQQYLGRVCAMADAAGVAHVSGYAFDRRPFCAIAGAIVREHCDLVVMATERVSAHVPWRRTSETLKLIQTIDAPVLVLH
ncbi:universal stress protein [Dyella sp.]|uniref:universal stress protein n=1 Tax=Dyella sp. TaxID=1869338 RepID=UPI002ED0AC90